MSAAPSHRVEELFLRAAEMPTADRRAFLERECAGDAETLREILSLLDHHSGEASFLDSKVAPGKGLLTQLGASALSEAEPLLPADKKIGNFQVLGQLGAGGMGVVYVAQQERPKRTVALKVMRRVMADPDSAAAQRVLRRFEHEAELLGRLHHPGIAQIFEAGTYEAGGLTHPYIAMELVKGEPLLAYAAKHNMATREKLVLLERVCDAMQHAHRNGVIHRDLKPANILVDETGRPKVLDFGVARTTTNELQLTSEHTAVGQLIGTLPYMSPEQVSGDPNAVDTRSDVYALGVILYELLAGKLPYDLSSRSLPEAARIIRDEEPTKLSSVDRVFRGDVEMIVAKALEKDRARRYQSANELGDDIARYLSGQPIAVRRDSAMYVLRKQLKRYRGVVTTAVFAFLVVLSLGVFSAIQAVRASRFAMTEQAAKTEALSNLKVAETERRRANDTAASLADQLARSNVERGRLLGMSGNLQAAEDLIWPAHLRNPNSRHTFFALWELYMHEPCLGSFQAHPGTISFLSATPDGKRAATTSLEIPAITVLDVAAMKIERSIPTPSVKVRWLALSPNGKLVAFVHDDNQVVFYDADTGSLIAQTEAKDQVITTAVFAADSASLLVGTRGGTTLRCTPSSSPAWAEFATSEAAITFINTSHDGRVIGTGHRDGSVRLWAADGSLQRTLRGHSTDVSAIGFSDDGALVATGALDRFVIVWKLGTGEQLSKLDLPNGTPRGILFTPDTERIFVSGWWTINDWQWRTQTVLRRMSLPASGISLFFANDAQEVWAGVANAIRGWNTDSSPAARNLSGHAGRTMATWSPDSRWIATGDASSTVRLWNADTLALERTMRASCGRVRALRFDNDARYLVVTGEGTSASVFDTADPNPEPMLVLAGIRGYSPRSIAFAPDNSVVVLPATDASHRILRLPDFVEVGRIDSANREESLAARFSPDGTMLATTDRDRAVRLWSWPERNLIATLRPETINPQPWSFEFTPDSKEMLVSGWNRNTELWDLSSMKLKQTFQGHGALVTDLAIRLREPMIFATASVDGTMKLWNRDHANEPVMLTIERFGSYEVNTVEWSPDGRKLLIGDSIGNAQVWNMRYFNRHIGGNMRYQLERHRSRLSSDIPIKDIEDQIKILQDRARVGW
ncbi:MAG TPA: serine/threonine-protein kinase [Phycisphaerales bacterium]